MWNIHRSWGQNVFYSSVFKWGQYILHFLTASKTNYSIGYMLPREYVTAHKYFSYFVFVKYPVN